MPDILLQPRIRVHAPSAFPSLSSLVVVGASLFIILCGLRLGFQRLGLDAFLHVGAQFLLDHLVKDNVIVSWMFLRKCWEPLAKHYGTDRRSHPVDLVQRVGAAGMGYDGVGGGCYLLRPSRSDTHR